MTHAALDKDQLRFPSDYLHRTLWFHLVGCVSEAVSRRRSRKMQTCSFPFACFACWVWEILHSPQPSNHIAYKHISETHSYGCLWPQRLPPTSHMSHRATHQFFWKQNIKKQKTWPSALEVFPKTPPLIWMKKCWVYFMLKKHFWTLFQVLTVFFNPNKDDSWKLTDLVWMLTKIKRSIISWIDFCWYFQCFISTQK